MADVPDLPPGKVYVAVTKGAAPEVYHTRKCRMVRAAKRMLLKDHDTHILENLRGLDPCAYCEDPEEVSRRAAAGGRARYDRHCSSCGATLIRGGDCEFCAAFEEEMSP